MCKSNLISFICRFILLGLILISFQGCAYYARPYSYYPDYYSYSPPRVNLNMWQRSPSYYNYAPRPYLDYSLSVTPYGVSPSYGGGFGYSPHHHHEHHGGEWLRPRGHHFH